LRDPSAVTNGQDLLVQTTARVRARMEAWMRSHRQARRLAECFFFVAFSSAFVRAAPGANRLIWAANGVWLAYLLMAPRRRWFAYLRAGFAAQLAGSVLVDPRWGLCVLLAVLNLCEVFIAAFLLRRGKTVLPCFTDRRYVLCFLACAVVAAPLVPGLIDAVVSHFWRHTPVGSELVKWMIADGLGFVAATPACVAIFRSRFGRGLSLKADWVYLIVAAGGCFAVCLQSKAPVQFLVYPLLVLILLRMGLGWASLVTLLTAAATGWSLLHGAGPFATLASSSSLQPGIVLQLFIASAMFILYSVSLVLESRRGSERRLLRIAALHQLVTETSRDVIIVADFYGNRKYVSAAGEGWGGWLREDILNHKSLSTVHPDDHAHAADAFRRLKDGADCASFECRVLSKSGAYVWAEVGMRTIRDRVTRAPIGILQNVRDITDRKLAEKRLQDAYHAVEALAITDSLTGLANRRQFDQALVTEWRRNMREHSPLSMLLIDADKFKIFNDTYGHLRGDSCLKQIAEAVQDAICRPGDLVARFGGEEFAVLLPGTANEGAMHLAREICVGLSARKLPHPETPTGCVTVSIGCATLVPQLGHHAAELVERADAALYSAKANGRNMVCNSKAESVAAKNVSLSTGVAEAISQRLV
jgi:diguanylate cyclase (GGDEF)-like protein/PAS domain S-box-containing protein